MEVASQSQSAAPVLRSAERSAIRAHKAELARQLQEAALEGDEASITPLLSELLRFQGLTQGQRIDLQLKALLSLVRALRSMALTDEPTGLYNWRGFRQTGRRLLDVAGRDERPVYLIHFSIERLAETTGRLGRSAGEILVRQTANFMRDLFPSYGVYEVLGRLSAHEFAALTTIAQYASPSAIALRLDRPLPRGSDLPALSLGIGVARFNPRRPVGLDELLADAKENRDVQRRATRIASAELTPHPA